MPGSTYTKTFLLFGLTGKPDAEMESCAGISFSSGPA